MTSSPTRQSQSDIPAGPKMNREQAIKAIDAVLIAHGKQPLRRANHD